MSKESKEDARIEALTNALDTAQKKLAEREALVTAAITALQQSLLLRLETKLALTSSYRFFRHVLRP